MTRFEELAKLGVEHARAFYALKYECESFASMIIRELVDYLQCPFGCGNGSVHPHSPNRSLGLENAFDYAASIAWNPSFWYAEAKENATIELTDNQLKALDAEQQPAAAVDPRTGQVYRLIKQEVYTTICGIIKPYNRGWDPDEDLIRKDA